jgi:histone H3/H4
LNITNRNFIFVSSANQYASNAKRKTVTVQDIFKALQSNHFDMLVEPLQESLKG